MKKNMKWLFSIIYRNRLELRLFLIFGMISTSINYAMYFTLHFLELNLFSATFFSFLFGAFFSFYFNKKYVFKFNKLANHKIYLKFILLYLLTAATSSWLNSYLHVHRNLNYKFSWIIALFAAVVINYIGLKTIFTEKKANKKRLNFFIAFTFMQDFYSYLLCKINPSVTHNIEKFNAIKKVFYMTAIDDIQGDYLEFGIFTGNSFCHAIRANNSMIYLNEKMAETKFYGFDSFEGFGKLQKDDNHYFYNDANFEVKYKKVLNRVSKVGEKGSFKLINGFFNNTLKVQPSFYFIKKIRILFIDSDTKESAMQALNFCFHHLQAGSFIILDDFYSYKGSSERGVAGAFFAFIKSRKITVRPVFNFGMGGIVYLVTEIANEN